jgi:hypothetical protein
VTDLFQEKVGISILFPSGQDLAHPAQGELSTGITSAQPGNLEASRKSWIDLLRGTTV